MVSLFNALMIEPNTVSPILPAQPPKPPLAPKIELIADCASESLALLLVLVVTVVPLTTVVVVLSCRAPIAPAMVSKLGAVFWKLEAANTPPLMLAMANCAPSWLAVWSETSATIASTSTCSRRVSS
ncbi:hypothetical protein D9M73_121160 [compost metagenome]